MYDPNEIGPALQRLRERRRLRQTVVAERLGRSTQTISRLEQAGANPQGSSLLRYLDAIGATLSDLDAEIAAKEPEDEPVDPPADDPLDEVVREVDQRLRDEPGLRRLAAEMLERLGGPEVSPELHAMATRLDDQEQRLAVVEQQLRPRREQG